MALNFCCSPFGLTCLPTEVKAACLCGKWDVAMPSFKYRVEACLPYIIRGALSSYNEWRLVWAFLGATVIKEKDEEG